MSTKLEIYNIGWLENSDFPKGDFNLNLLNKIKTILFANRVNLSRGISYCKICKTREHIYINYKDKQELLGISEFWIPNKNYSNILVAPDLIIHYIEIHNYLPPEDFIDNVMNFDVNSDWNGNDEFKKYIDDTYKQ
jgi:hypothetical protein